MTWCKNPLCETEAIEVAIIKGDHVPVCGTCSTAMSMLDARDQTDLQLIPIEDWDEPECATCHDKVPVEYRKTCDQCESVMCHWCYDEHHGVCSPDCLAVQNEEARGDYRFDAMREG
jgi:hypothetical protein